MKRDSKNVSEFDFSNDEDSKLQNHRTLKRDYFFSIYGSIYQEYDNFLLQRRKNK